MARPPEDDGLGDLLTQVDEALSEAGVGSQESRDALVDGVRAALQEALGTLGSGSEPRPQAQVRVLDGGRADEQRDESDPEAARPRDHLRVAEHEGEEGAAGDGDAENTTPRVTSVRVVRVPSATRSAPVEEPTPLRVEGQLSVDEGQLQTVFRGTQPRAYRMSCGRGRLTVIAEGVAIERIGPGQTVDIEAAMIRVRGEEHATRGRYARLR